MVYKKSQYHHIWLLDFLTEMSKRHFFSTIYTYNRNVINLLPHLVEAYTAKCIRCIKTLALSLLRPEAILAFQASFLSLCFLELVAFTPGKISPVWLILQLWNFADVFSIKLPKWCQSSFFISKKNVHFLDLRVSKITLFYHFHHRNTQI